MGKPHYRPHHGDCPGPGACEPCSRVIGCCFRGESASPECMKSCPCPDPRDPGNRHIAHPPLARRPPGLPVRASIEEARHD